MGWKLCLVVLCFAYQVEAQSDIGDICIQDNKYGTCRHVLSCMSGGRRWWTYNRCGFIGDYPIICCPPLPNPTTTTTRVPVATTPQPSSSRTATEYTPETYDYVTVDNMTRHAPNNTIDENGCIPLDPSWTAEKKGRKAWDKCIEYQRELVYPCERSYVLGGGMARGRHCRHAADQLIVGGADAAQYEFPHMVLLGFGRTNGTEDWQCGGTLISERFILTAAHCTSQRGDPIMFAIVGSHRRTDDVSSSQVYRIIGIIKHPRFNASAKSNDIALLQTDRNIALDQTIVPACLDVFGGDITHAVATGWGATELMGTVSDTLQKVTLTKFNDSECIRYLPKNRHNARYDGRTQMCYGDYSAERDTCQGDSGGPLTILNHKVHCMYSVVGVTSFGKMCGYRGIPGWYTKVAPYVHWIERIVWP